MGSITKTPPTAVRYSRDTGLGIGLVSRAACAKTDEIKKAILNTNREGFGLPIENFKCPDSNTDPHERAALLGISLALARAKKVIISRWNAAPSSVPLVVIFLARSGRETKRHIKYAPESLEGVQDTYFWPVVKTMRRIDKIRSFGFKVSIVVSDCNKQAVTLAMSRADKKFKRLLLEMQKDHGIGKR
jgi:hypothetical protein